MTEAYKEWLLNEKNNIVKMVQERDLERRLIAEECIKNINFLRQTFGFYPIELEDQSIKVGPSEKDDVFENKEEIYDNMIIEYKFWFFLKHIETEENYLRLFELIKEKKNKDNYSKLCR
ncbi:18499_t:CDS:2, partial [Racocetra persica]